MFGNEYSSIYRLTTLFQLKGLQPRHSRHLPEFTEENNIKSLTGPAGIQLRFESVTYRMLLCVMLISGDGHRLPFLLNCVCWISGTEVFFLCIAMTVQNLLP